MMTHYPHVPQTSMVHMPISGFDRPSVPQWQQYTAEQLMNPGFGFQQPPFTSPMTDYYHRTAMQQQAPQSFYSYDNSAGGIASPGVSAPASDVGTPVGSPVPSTPVASTPSKRKTRIVKRVAK